MWVVWFNGTATYWLVGGASYSIGRKDTDIIVLDDPSVSRSHVTLQIACSSTATLFPHSIQITDTSRYGSVIKLNGNSIAHPIAKGTFTLPQGLTEFTLVVGTHGLEFQLRWRTSTAALGTISEEALTKLQHSLLPRCGVSVVPDVASCDVFVATEVDATQGIVASLCAGKPIVSPDYFEAMISQRHNCKVPLPDPSLPSFVPPVNAEVWGPFFPAITTQHPPSAAADALRTLFTVRKERVFLLSDTAFVCPQSVLYDEVVSFVPLAQGKVFADSSLLAAAAQGPGPVNLDAFLVRHSRHVLLYTKLAQCVPESLLGRLEAHRMVLLEYSDLLRSIVEVRRLPCRTTVDLLDAPLPPEGGGGTCSSVASSGNGKDPDGGRKTARLLFLDDDGTTSPRPSKLPRKEGVDAHRATATSATSVAREGGEEDLVSRWRSRDVLQSFASHRHSEMGDAGEHPRSAEGGGAHENEEEDLIVHGPLKLPPFPCFRRYVQDPTSATSPAGHEDTGKKFRKQSILTSAGPFVGYESVAQSTAAAMLVGRIAPIDADDVVSMRVDDVRPLHDTMNLFDVAEQNRKATSKKRNVTSKAAASVSSRPVAAPPTASVVAVAAPLVAAHPPAPDLSPPPPPRRPAGGAVNVFDLDALF